MNEYYADQTQKPDDKVNELFSLIVEYHGKVNSRVAVCGNPLPEDEEIMRDTYAQLRTLTGNITDEMFPAALPKNTKESIGIVERFISGLRDDVGLYTVGLTKAPV